MNIEFSKFTGKEYNDFTSGMKHLIKWIEDLKFAAKNDERFSVDWFPGTKNYPIAIVGGWLDGYDPADADLFCLSKSNPTYGMSIKIVINEGNYAYCDFETLDMPVDPSGEVDDTCLTLEWDDSPEAIASFFMHELSRITRAHENGVY